MKICQVRQLTIGEGKPKICVPVVETTTEKIIQQIQELQNCDLIELRIDFYENIHDLKQVHELLLQVRPVSYTHLDVYKRQRIYL